MHAADAFQQHLGRRRFQHDSSRAELERARALSPRDPLVARWYERWREAMSQAPAPALDVGRVPRDPDDARRLLEQAESLRSERYVTPLTFALAATVAHDSESLFRWLEVAYDERCGQLPYLLRNPVLPQSDPMLQDLLRRLKLPINQ